MLLCFSMGFLIKFVLMVICASIFYRNRRQIAESLVCGWLIVYSGMIAMMLALSCFEAMNRICIYGGGILSIVVMILYCRCVDKKCLRTFILDIWNNLRYANTITYIAICGFLLLSAYIIGHNSLFFDGTWDAHTYELPRIELFVQKETLFVNMRSEAINIFSNEWNGELNAAFYAILCGTNQGMFLANAENFIYSLLAVYWFCRKIGINKNYTFGAMLGYCGMPAVVFLAMVVKGDFVTVPFFLTAVAWLKDYIESKQGFSFFFLMTAGGLAAGSKISMVPFLGLSAFSAAAHLAIENRSNPKMIFSHIAGIWKELSFGIICAIITCARYVVNFVFMGNFFARVEKLKMTWEHLKVSVVELLRQLIESDDMFTGESPVWALNKDMGIVGSIFVLLFLPTAVAWVFKRLKEKRAICKFFFIGFPIMGSLLALLAGTAWMPWSFRYILPQILFFFFCWISMLQEVLSDIHGIFANIAVSAGMWLMIINMASTIVLTTRFGEATHSSWTEARPKTMIAREYGFHYPLLESPEGLPDIYDFFDQIRAGKKVLICNGVDTAVSYLFGEDNSNDVTFCVPEELPSMLAEEEWDVVSVFDGFLTPALESYFSNGNWTCYTPRNDVIKAHVYLGKR